jgi:hypothetical protein
MGTVASATAVGAPSLDAVASATAFSASAGVGVDATVGSLAFVT